MYIITQKSINEVASINCIQKFSQNIIKTFKKHNDTKEKYIATSHL